MRITVYLQLNTGKVTSKVTGFWDKNLAAFRAWFKVVADLSSEHKFQQRLMLVSGTNEVIDVTRPSVVALEVELIGMRACFKAPPFLAFHASSADLFTTISFIIGTLALLSSLAIFVLSFLEWPVRTLARSFSATCPLWVEDLGWLSGRWASRVTHARILAFPITMALRISHRSFPLGRCAVNRRTQRI